MDNISPQQLMYIKKVQNEYFEKFGTKLIIDFREMKKIKDFQIIKYTCVPFDAHSALEFLESSCKKNGTTIDRVKKRLNNSSKQLKERKVVKEYSEFIYQNGWSPREAAEFISKERTTILYHNRKKINFSQKKEK